MEERSQFRGQQRMSLSIARCWLLRSDCSGCAKECHPEFGVLCEEHTGHGRFLEPWLVARTATRALPGRTVFAQHPLGRERSLSSSSMRRRRNATSLRSLSRRLRPPGHARPRCHVIVVDQLQSHCPAGSPSPLDGLDVCVRRIEEQIGFLRARTRTPSAFSALQRVRTSSSSARVSSASTSS